MIDTLVSLALLVGILGLSALFTTWFARTMYIRCQSCGTLNTRRRTHCRVCQQELPPHA